MATMDLDYLLIRPTMLRAVHEGLEAIQEVFDVGWRQAYLL
jgi:hypothetical protein